MSESQQREAILNAAREWSGLWLFDNYESIIQGIQEKQPEAESIHRLIADLANGDADMLLTSREQPAGLRNERLFPDGNHALHGLGDGAGVELFFQHSVKAKEDARAHADFALAVQRAADGHPLMEEVVAIDEQTGHQDLESDRERLEVFRRIASLTPEEREQLRQKAQAEQESPDPDGEDNFEALLQEQLAKLPPEQRAEVEAQLRKGHEEYLRMSPEEQAAVQDQRQRRQIEKAANQVRDAGLAYFRRQAPKRDVLQMLEGASKEMKVGESAGSPWLEVSALCDALVALIQEESIPPVPAAYASHFSSVLNELKT